MKLKAVRRRTSKFLLGCFWQLPENNTNNNNNNNNTRIRTTNHFHQTFESGYTLSCSCCNCLTRTAVKGQQYLVSLFNGCVLQLLLT